MAGVWSAGGSLSIARDNLAGCGTQDAGLSFGGNDASPGYFSVTEEYNGTSWSASGSLGTARMDLGGCGTQDAGLSFGGLGGDYYTFAVTEEYNGTSWSAGGSLLARKIRMGGCGTQNAGLCFGGLDSGSGFLSTTEEYNGTSWSAGGSIATATIDLAGCGTQDAGLCFGGRDSNNNYLSTTEEYNGTSWSAGGSLLEAKRRLAGCGTQNAGLCFGGQDSDYNILSTTEEYNGTSWSASGLLLEAKYDLAGCGTQNAGLCFGGQDSDYNPLSTTEEYTITPSTYTISGNVKDGDSVNLEDVVITLENGTDYETDTDVNGNYTQEVDPDTYIVTASKTGYVSDSAIVDASAGDQTQNFTLIRPVISGNVKDNVGHNLPDVNITFKNDVSYDTTTDSDGNYSQIVNPDSYTVTASVLGGGLVSETESVDATNSDQTQDFVLDRTTSQDKGVLLTDRNLLQKDN